MIKRFFIVLIISALCGFAFANPPGTYNTLLIGGVKTWTLTDHGTNYGTSGNRTKNPVSTIPVGASIYVCFAERTNTASSATITDSKGNTYTSDKHQLGGSSTLYAEIFHSNITTQLGVGDTITGTPVTGGNASGMLILSASVQGTKDTAVGQADAGGFTSLTSGTPAVSNELFVACGADTNSAMTLTNNGGGLWTAPFTSGGSSGAGASDIAAGGGSQVVATVTTKSVLFTSAGGPNASTIIVTYQ